MRLTIKKENGKFVTRIWLKQNLVLEQYGYGSREDATLNAWTNALLIREIVIATQKSVEALVNA